MSDDLTAALREVAADYETPAPGPGAEVRRRAALRRRRRRAAVGVAGIAVAGVVIGLSAFPGTHNDRGSATTPMPGISRVTAAQVTVDLSRHRMSVAGRELPVSAGIAKFPTPTGQMTVTAKYREKSFPASTVGLGGGYTLTLPWVIEFRTPDGGTDYVVALTYYDTSVLGARDVTHGWIGLRPADAEWLYQNVRQGTAITVTSQR